MNLSDGTLEIGTAKSDESEERPELKHVDISTLLRLKSEFDLMMRSQGCNRWYNSNICNRNERVRVLFGVVQKLCEMLDFSVRTFELAVHIFDSMTSKFPVEKSQMLPLALVSLQLASKMHEKQESLVTYSDFKTYIFEFEISRFVCLERTIVEQLGFKLNIQGQCEFLDFFVHAFTQPGFGFFDGIPDQLREKAMQRFFEIAFQLHLTSLVDYEFYHYTSFAVGFSIVGVARELMGLPPFTPQMTAFTKVEKLMLGDCWRLLKQNHLRGFVPRVFAMLDERSKYLAMESPTNVAFHDNFSANVKNFFVGPKRFEKYLESVKGALTVDTALNLDRDDGVAAFPRMY